MDFIDVLSTILIGALAIGIVPFAFLWSMNVLFHTTYPFDFKHVAASLFILLLLFGIMH